MPKTRYILETIYEQDEETELRKNPICKPTKVKVRLSHYVCWSLIVSIFLLISVLIGFSINPFSALQTAEFRNEVKQFYFEFDRSIVRKHRLKYPKVYLQAIDEFADQINADLHLSPQTIRIFTVTFSEFGFDWNSLNSNKKHTEGSMAVYIHLSYPKFCAQHQTCKENFQLHLNTTWAKLSHHLKKNKLTPMDSSDSLSLSRCPSIESSTSFTSIVFLSSTQKNLKVPQTQVCDKFDHDSFLQIMLDLRHRHYHISRRSKVQSQRK